MGYRDANPPLAGYGRRSTPPMSTGRSKTCDFSPFLCTQVSFEVLVTGVSAGDNIADNGSFAMLHDPRNAKH